MAQATGAGLIILVVSSIVFSSCENGCSKAYGCLGENQIGRKTRYILYDVNIGEGFNLKRDVYMRMAMFVRNMVKQSEYDWNLVLPPWSKQWHWTSEHNQVSFLWNKFFDMFSMQLYSPVIELDQYYNDNGNSVDEVYILQHFPEFYQWTSNSNSSIDWSERWKIAECRDHPYWKKDNGEFVFFRGKNKVITKQVKCISFRGTSAYLESVILTTEAKSVMFDRAEIATHITYGDSEYWMCRRSMRFAKHLINVAHEFRATYLNSTNEQDGTVLPLDWRKERPQREARGGPYLGVHLRRKDFVFGRPNEVPSLEQTMDQVRKYLAATDLSVVFIATDMDTNEYTYIEKKLSLFNIKVVKYVTNKQISDGELAIIDQIIVSHARVFVGTHKSTFSYRIQEEREIMGFPVDTTFNRFCPRNANKGCTPPAKWLIEYPTEPVANNNLNYRDHSEF